VTGDPAFAANDVSQIEALRTLIDQTCLCEDYDGSGPGKRHGDFVRCAKNLISSAVLAGDQLRKQCRGTVIKIYAKSTCGFPVPSDAAKTKVACIKQITRNDAILCTIKPKLRCIDKPGSFVQQACPTYEFCVDATDDNHNYVFLRDPTGGDDALCGAGEDCIACHSQPTADRRPGVTDFFANGSHHIKRPPSKPLSEYDCVICHLEGDSAGETTEYHNETGNEPGHVVNLRNVDDASSPGYTWDDPDVPALGSTPNGAPASCATPNERTELTMFCQGCHDSDGFGDISFLDEVDASDDEVNRSSGDPFGDGQSPPDVSSQFDPDSYSTHSSSCRKNGGVWSSGYKDPTFPGIAPESWNSGWHEDATTECSDCHMPGGSGTPGSWTNNAHGSENTRYLLDTFDGSDSPVIDTSDPTASNVVCFKCHNRTTYLGNSVGSRYPDHHVSYHEDPSYSWLSSPAGGDTGIGCFNCHAGDTHGGIHGSNHIVVDDEGGEPYPSYVFLNGACLDGWLYQGDVGGLESFSLSSRQSSEFFCLEAAMQLIKNYTRQY
jgi:hypothetical protein